MIQQHSAGPSTFEPLPSTLESPTAKLVYLYLETAGATTLDDLNETLSMKKITVLSVLRSLSSEGLVDKSDGRYVVTA